MDELLMYVAVDVHVNAAVEANTTLNKTLSSIEEDITVDISSKVRVITTFGTIVKKCLSLTIFLMFCQSFWYVRNYLANYAYDNIYITKDFVLLDKQSSHPVLPLKKKEKSLYVLASSWKLDSRELSNCRLGLAEVLLHFLLCLVILAFDLALYYILFTTAKHGQLGISANGRSNFDIEVSGKGLVADFYRALLGSTSFNNNFTIGVDIGACLPNPSAPSTSIIPVLLILYLVALAFVVSRGYGMRLRRKIAAYYYPEQERERLEYLHKKIRHRRVGFMKSLAKQILPSHKESQAKDAKVLDVGDEPLPSTREVFTEVGEIGVTRAVSAT